MHQLLQNLDTPSQSVQEAISGCLVPLVPSVREEAEEILRGLLDKVGQSMESSDALLSFMGACASCLRQSLLRRERELPMVLLEWSKDLVFLH